MIHAAYFLLLAAGYRHGELSTVYPLARGTGVAGTALLAWAVLGERPSTLGALGIGAVCLGILFLGLRERHRQARCIGFGHGIPSEPPSGERRR